MAIVGDGSAAAVQSRRRFPRRPRWPASVVLGVVALVIAVGCAPPPPRPPTHFGPIPVHFSSPNMGRDLPVYRGIDMPTLNLGGAGWDDFSSALLEPGTVVLFAHRVSHGGPFRTLDQLHPGNVVFITGSDSRTYVYEVINTVITGPSWAEILAWKPPSGHGLTLVACHPPGSTRYRIVVHADLFTVA